MDSSADEKLLLARARDAVLLCERQYAVKTVGFLTPAEAAAIKKNIHTLGASPDIRLEFFGGYGDAERCLFAVLPEYADKDTLGDFITAITVSGRDIKALGHRDFLGSLLGLGLRRDKIGDILVLEDRTVVFVLSDIADYIVENLTKVGNCGVRAEAASLEGLELPARGFEELRLTVAALRLDCIVAAAARTSRSNAAELIRSGRVFLNWLECDSTSATVKPSDVFSIRGIGKFRLGEEVNQTKKGRLGICIERFI